MRELVREIVRGLVLAGTDLLLCLCGNLDFALTVMLMLIEVVERARNRKMR